MGNELEQLLLNYTLDDIIHSMPYDHPIQIELENRLEQARQESVREICDYLQLSLIDDELLKVHLIDNIKERFGLKG